jgi:hypothetical protein
VFVSRLELGKYLLKIRCYPTFHNYNQQVLEQLELPEAEEPHNHTALWDKLGRSHVKGIDSITHIETGIELLRADVQALCIRASTRRPTSPIIRSV